MSRSVRETWLQNQRYDLERAHANKQSSDALLSISARYRGLSADVRPVIDELLSEHIVSEDSTTRFIALALVEEFKIESALPALRKLAVWLETQNAPGAPYEWAKVNRIVASFNEE